MLRGANRSWLTPLILIPLAALLAILPLLIKGGSCGHDMVFHVQGWYDAAAQLRHVHYPHWSYTSAWNAGEPRFIFYPPLSWLLGAVLTLMLPPQAAVSAFLFLTLTLAGLTMYRLAAHFTSPVAALIAAMLYLANPYMLFNGFERSAFAELLAAAWVPLLLLAVLRRHPTVAGIAVPLALLWLTNAPAAVMGSYTLALLATLSVLLACKRHAAIGPGPGRPSALLSPDKPLRLAFTYIAGALLGLGLAAFFLVPAAYERRYIQVALALIPNMRIQDNFLFTLTADPGHNGVNHQISLLALALLALTGLAVLALLVLARLRVPRVSTRGAAADAGLPRGSVQLALVVLTVALTFLFFPLSLPLWNHTPELSFLQFPWRLLTIVSAVLTFTLALLLQAVLPGLPPKPPQLASYKGAGGAVARVLLLILPAALGYTGFQLYAQFCQPNDRPAAIAQNLQTHHGFPPTDEYTPNAFNTVPARAADPDSDVLRTDNPAFWLIPEPAAQPAGQRVDANTPAPGTVPTAAELNPDLQTDDTPVPLAQSTSYSAPGHLTLNLARPAILVLNLRDYFAWQVSDTTPTRSAPAEPAHLQRDDGLLALALPAGSHTIDIRWRTSPDQQLGLALSGAAMLILLGLAFARPTPHEPAHHDHPTSQPHSSSARVTAHARIEA